MENNQKKNSGLIVLVILLILCVIGLAGYVIYSNLLKTKDKKIDNNLSTYTKNSIVKKSEIPSNLSDYSMLYWNYNEIYNYYFKMNENDKRINIDTSFKDVKVDSNKLYWNIDGNWVSDKNIVDDVKYFNMSINPLNSEYFIVVTEANKIYYITFEDVCFYCDGENLKELSYEMYSKFKYNEISFQGVISKVSEKIFTECEGWKEYYFEIEGNIYVLNRDNKLTKLDEFMKDVTITRLNNTCSPAYGLPLTIEQDGTINGIVDEKNDKINVKHYILLVKNENDYYHIVVDKDDNLYIVNKDQKNQSVYDKVTNFTYEKDEYGNEKLIIDTENSKSIIKEIKQSSN